MLPVLELRHSRARVLPRLLLLQIIPAGVALMLWLAWGIDDDIERIQAWIGIVLGVAMYVPFLVVTVQKLIDPRYFTLYPDGSGVWVPFLRPRRLAYPPGVTWSLSPDELRFDHKAAPLEAAPATIPIPPTILRPKNRA